MDPGAPARSLSGLGIQFANSGQTEALWVEEREREKGYQPPTPPPTPPPPRFTVLYTTTLHNSDVYSEAVAVITHPRLFTYSTVYKQINAPSRLEVILSFNSRWYRFPLLSYSL